MIVTRKQKRKNFVGNDRPIKKLFRASLFQHFFDDVHLYTHKDVVGSVCQFVLRSIPLASIVLPDFAKIIFGVIDQVLWMKRNFVEEIVQSISEDLKAQLPLDTTSILVTFTMTHTSYFDLHIYGHHDFQLEYLQNPLKFIMLTEDMKFSLQDCSSTIVSPTSKKQRSCIGINCNSLFLKTNEIKSNWLSQSLTYLQQTIVCKVLECLQNPLFKVVGGLFKKNKQYFTFSQRFRFLQRICENGYKCLKLHAGALIASTPGSGKTLMVKCFFFYFY